LIIASPVNILLVDNEPDSLALLAAFLEQTGLNLVLADSGEEALRQIHCMDFTAIVLDLHMLGISGFEVARRVRAHERSKSTPIIFVTGADPRSFPIEQAYALGAVDYLVKPVNPTILCAKVAVFVELYRKTEALALTERARHVTALGMKNEQIRLILSNAKGYAFVVTDLHGQVTEWEGASEMTTGWAVKEMLGQPLARLFTPEDRTSGIAEYEFATAKAQGLAEYQRWHMRKDASRFLAQAVLIALKDTSHQLYGFAHIFRDTTTEQQAAEKMRASERKLQESRGLFSLLQSSVDGIFGIRADTSCMFFNAPGAAMLGYKPEELTGVNLHSLIHHHHSDGSVYPVADCPLNHAAQGGMSLRVDEDVFWHKNGSPVPVAYSVAPLMVDGKPCGAVITFSDITERKRHDAEREQLLKEVQAANNRLADVFRQAPAFMAVFRGPAHVFEMVNDRYLALVGNRNPIGIAVRQALPELAGQGFFELLDTVFKTGEPFVGLDRPIALQRQAAGPAEMRSIDFVYMALRDADGAVSGVLLHGVDQTERKHAETALRASEARYRMLFESMDQGLCIVEMLKGGADGAPIDFRILEVNAMVYKHTGLAGSVGRTIRELAPDVESHWMERFATVALNGQPGPVRRFQQILEPLARRLRASCWQIRKQENSPVVQRHHGAKKGRKRAAAACRRLGRSRPPQDRVPGYAGARVEESARARQRRPGHTAHGP
jgi:PAS domain S-box-containing protein